MDFQRKKTELFAKAGEVGREFGAEVGAVIVSSDGESVYTFSDWRTILAKFVDSESPTALYRFTTGRHEKQVPVEINAQKEAMMMELLDRDVKSMTLIELDELRDQITERMKCTANRKCHLQRKQELKLWKCYDCLEKGSNADASTSSNQDLNTILSLSPPGKPP